ncbi:mitochondrial CCA tRNA nucleotidyltransferase [Diplogelasinospora grovesii]|uniref:Mitochondrial CCA tRNA nucleotidyltransferase n=1 Tax=Diplogelasinospora grovesii TaxID=303347 RepID=A0AAN6NGP2_9PEZI|nr:mitochondrial CCA tRNA nucleotidyltransferase [Diplogelasinospora grovesii]
MAQPRTITLNEREQKLKGLLVDVAQFIDTHHPPSTPPVPGQEKVVLRWAGGWVRDKLLGVESNDIDTAINNMTGETFALYLRDYCNDPGHRGRHGILPSDIGGLHKIAKNPEKSKHLETTTTRLFGLDVDFVNLRKETYSEDSRNPTIEFGTAEEDALRRDATVNALFYNLHTEEVEDFTGGLKDMEEKIIRTPLEPLQTFMDDPLRVLRLVRFASRLEFRIDPEAEKVMGEPKVLEMLRLKISRERIGVELEKMLKGKNPRVSLELIDRLGLYHAVFTDPAKEDMVKPDLTNWHTVYNTLDKLKENKTPGSIYEVLVTSEEAGFFAWNLAALCPWEQLPEEKPVKAGKHPLPLASQAAREGFRAPNKLCDVVTAAHRHRQNILELKEIVCNKEESRNERDRFGMAIREWDARGGQWRLQVLYAVLVDLLLRTGPEKEEVQKVLAEWQAFLDHLVELDVMDAPSIRRLVDGTVLAKELGIKPGKWMAPALDIVMAWQLRNPGVTEQEGAVEENPRQRIIAVFTCVHGESVSEDLLAANGLATLIAGWIAPIINRPDPMDLDEEGDSVWGVQEDDPHDTIVRRTRELAEPGMMCLEILLCSSNLLYIPSELTHLDTQVLFTLVAFTDDDRDGWSTPELRGKAETILEKHLLPTPDRREYLMLEMLQSYLRPLFSRSRPATITSSGRRAEYNKDGRGRGGVGDDSRRTKPWKFEDLRAVPGFNWVVNTADKEFVSKNWPLFIPVLLTLLDERSIRIKARGLSLTTTFLTKLPGKTLEQTGLSQVFEDAILPSLLSYLPTLTPEDESVQILKPAFEALLWLAKKQEREDRKRKLLDKMLREGVFAAYFHAREHIKIVTLLCEVVGGVVKELGLHSVKHLKDLVPMLSEIMTDPFAPLSPTVLLSAVRALQVVVLMCWPRFITPDQPCADNVLEAVVVCWLNVTDADAGQPNAEEVQNKLRETAKLLSAIYNKTASGSSGGDVFKVLVDKEPRLASLFTM